MRKKRSTTLWIGSIALAFISAVTVFFVLLGAQKNALAEFEKETVYIAKTDIPKGQKIDGNNYRMYMEAVEVETRYVPDQALRETDTLKETVSGWNIEKGVILTKGMFCPVDRITENMKEPVIAGLKADDIYQVTGGVLRSGDRIHIFGVAEDGTVTLKWSNVYVQQAFDHTGNAIAVSDTVTAAQRINIYLDKDEVEKLYTDLGTGTLRVVKVCE